MLPATQATMEAASTQQPNETTLPKSPFSLHFSQPFFMPLPGAIFDLAKEKHRVLDGMNSENWYLVTTPVLASMKVPVLRAVGEGSLSKDFQQPGPIREALKATAENSRNRPGTYALVLAEKNWESPTAREPLDAIKTVRAYCGTGAQADKLAAKVGTQMNNRRNSRVKALPPDHRRYLAKKSDGRVSSAKRDMILEFCTELENRLRGLPNLDDPIEYPLFYFGWSANLQQRINQHTNHQSSNETVDLFHAALMLFFESRGSRILAFPLCFLTKPAQSAIAEVLFTVLGNGYRPYGFNSRPTCLNNDSANTIHSQGWALNAAYIQYATPFVLNMQNEERYIKISTQVIGETMWAELERAVQPVEMDYSECDAALDRLNATFARLDKMEARIDELSDFPLLDEIHA
ncbi:hypothetical protein DIS24_g2294 [Lasiodiplodia hormozganensis]|uniref:Uncharacterized protein n=1 Tax=Lasiodiplodia hormozganensis TaxID=869390 RepID=A0AA40D671_9PEZI|nr:hypothetical protein DIS24_g2294 [Lasiodiplodia hormozganensis]